MYKFDKLHPIRQWLLVIIADVFFGVFGYMLIDHFNFLDALYMAVITITTVGYHEIGPFRQAKYLISFS